MNAKPVNASTVERQPVDPDTIARLCSLLLSERSAQSALAAEHDAIVTGLVGQGDVDSMLEGDVAKASAARARAVIKDVDDALGRMDAGTYGLCESCGDPIPIERLETIPYGRLCVVCPGQRSGFLR